jgi:hypothetical protein
MTISFAGVVCASWGDIAAGAQTERRAVPGRWGSLLGGKDPTGR